MSDSADHAPGRPDALHRLYGRLTARVDDSPYAAARTEAEELGAPGPDPLAADTIRLLARLLDVRAAVCLAPAPAVPALAVLGAGRGRCVVTCITEDPHHLEVARGAIRVAGYPSTSARFIAARPLDVVDRLADGGYDMVVAEVEPAAVPRLTERAGRLLRDGGALVLRGVDPDVVAAVVAEVETAQVTCLPVDGGITVLTY